MVCKLLLTEIWDLSKIQNVEKTGAADYGHLNQGAPFATGLATPQKIPEVLVLLNTIKGGRKKE